MPRLRRPQPRPHLGHVSRDGCPARLLRQKRLPEGLDLGAKVVQVSCGQTHTCALVEGGLVRCWGENAEGQLGRNHTKSVGGVQGDMPPKDALIYPNP